MEPRTGKTKCTIDWLSILALKGLVDRVMIVVPNRVMGTWVSEFQVHCPVTYNITVWDAKARKSPPPPVSGLYQLEILIVNYEAFATPGPKTASGRESKTGGRWRTRKLIQKWLDGGKTAAGILDESHKIKAPSGRAARLIVSMSGDFEKRAILTGTPVTKASRVFDIYMQWLWLNPRRFADVPTLAEFKARYSRWVDLEIPGDKSGRTYPRFLGAKNLPELKKRINKDGIIVRREDCFDLPPREDIVRYVELKGSKKAYDEMAEEMIALLEDGDIAEAQIKLVQALRLQQITSGFVTTETGETKRLGFEKSDALEDLLVDLFEKDQKVVVAAKFKPDMDLIEELGKRLGFQVWSIRGKVKRADSDAAIVSFRKTDKPAIMVIHPAAASLGIDLSTASTMIWYSHTSSWVDFTQACDRIALSRNSTTFYHLVVKYSVDEAVLSTLAADGDLAKEIMKKPSEMIKGSSLNVDSQSRIKVVSSKRKRRRI